MDDESKTKKVMGKGMEALPPRGLRTPLELQQQIEAANRAYTLPGPVPDEMMAKLHRLCWYARGDDSARLNSHELGTVEDWLDGLKAGDGD